MSSQLSLEKQKIKILLLEAVHPGVRKFLEEHGYTNIEQLATSLEPKNLREKIRDVHILGIRSRTYLDRETLATAKKLMAIGCFCIGTNQVNLEQAAAQGIPVFNAPHSNTRSVAELVIGQTIMLVRGIFAKSLAAHRGQWQKSAKNSFEVRGKTIGIVGYGHIGSQVSVLAEAMGMHVVYYDIVAKLPLGNAERMTTFEALLERSDVVTLHVPGTPQTHHLINRRAIAQMKKGAFLINDSRGDVVEIEALVKALRSGHLGGAAIDVFPVEPGNADQPFQSELQNIDNVILSPHVGGSTIEAQINIGLEVGNRLIQFSDCGATDGSVNFPVVNLIPNPKAHRLLHIHANRPGMMQRINTVVGEEQINVLSQYLSTYGEIGYVVLDIAKSVTRPQLSRVRTRLKAIEGTIRTRVLY